MAKVQKKLFVCNFTPNILCLVILLFHQSNLVTSRLPNFQYHVDSLVDTRKALLSYFAETAGGCWILTSQSTLRERNYNCSRGFSLLLYFLLKYCPFIISRSFFVRYKNACLMYACLQRHTHCCRSRDS